MPDLDDEIAALWRALNTQDETVVEFGRDALERSQEGVRVAKEKLRDELRSLLAWAKAREEDAVGVS